MHHLLIGGSSLAKPPLQHLRLWHELQRLLREGDTACKIAREEGEVRTNRSDPAEDAACKIGRHICLDTLFSIMQANLGGLQLIGEHQHECAVKTEACM